ncbi:MAG: hypothetical protein M3438_04680 [Pseudomonadota bacterium]|nr:hypothetical protein [Pseudomonadota bacterium]
MRELIFLGAAALALAGCGQKQSAEEQAAAEQNVTTQVVATNDTTAIDAATGQDANMAAESAFLPDIDVDADGNEAAAQPSAAGTNSVQSRTRPAKRRDPAPAATADDEEPEGNSL